MVDNTREEQNSLAFEDRLMAVLEDIRTSLAVLSAERLAALETRLSAEVLKTETRIKVYQAVDGKAKAKEIADSVGLSLRRTQEVLQTLHDEGLIVLQRDGGSNVPRRDPMRILAALSAAKPVITDER